VLTNRHINAWTAAIDDFTMWMEAGGKAKGTIRQRRWQLRKLAETYLNRSPWKLSTTDLVNWYASRDWGIQTRHCARSALRAFYSWAVTTKRTKRSPAEDLPTIKVPRNLPRPASEDVLHRALESADDRVRLMLILAAYAGLRDVEIAGLRWTDITDTHLIVTGKGNATRQLWQHPTIAAEISAERTRRDAGMSGSGFVYKLGLDVYLFPGRKGGPLTPGRVCELLSEALGGGTTGHQLRHRFATEILNETGDLAAVQDLLGHANSETTRVYTRVADHRLRDAVNSIK
jgi:site-specific recombinase XerD